MEDFISADPCTFDHANLFRMLQNLTLDYRLNDPYASLVSLLFTKKPTFIQRANVYNYLTN